MNLDIDWSVMTTEDLDHMVETSHTAVEIQREKVLSMQFMIGCVLRAIGGSVSISPQVIYEMLEQKGRFALTRQEEFDGVVKLSLVEVSEE